jgi:hypothetical protein
VGNSGSERSSTSVKRVGSFPLDLLCDPQGQIANLLLIGTFAAPGRDFLTTTGWGRLLEM